MSAPTTRAEFRAHCLRAIGAEVIKINVSPAQVEDRIDEALAFYRDYHYGGQKSVVIAHTLTALDLQNGYIVLPATTASVNGIYKSALTASGIAGTDLLSVARKITLEDVLSAGSGQLTGYFIVRQHIATLDHLLTPMVRYRYNLNDTLLHLDVNFNFLTEGSVVVFETFQDIVPEDDPKTWQNRVFQALCAAYLKRQWGDNLSKFGGIQLAGGVQLNGDAILSSAQAEIDKLESDFIMRYQFPDFFEVG